MAYNMTFDIFVYVLRHLTFHKVSHSSARDGQCFIGSEGQGLGVFLEI